MFQLPLNYNPALLVSPPCLQPSVYLRLLDNPSAVVKQSTFHCCPKSPRPPSLPPSPSQPTNPLSPLRAPSPNVPERHYPERTSPDQAAGHSSERSTQQVTVEPVLYSMRQPF